MYGINGSGQTVMGHAGNLAQLRFAESCIGKNDTERGIAGEFVLSYLIALPHQFSGRTKSVFSFIQQTGNLSAVFPVVNITKGVQDDERADFQLIDLNGISANAGFHTIIDSGIFAHRGTASCAKAAVSVIGGFHGQPGTGIAHGGIRPDRGISDGQIVNIRLDH